jgi:hypothetical protein
MPGKKALLEKLCRKPITKNFTKQELDSLMGKCGCEKRPGGRGSSIRYYHKRSERILTFDEPHPENELYTYQVKKVIQFLQEIGEISEQ